MTAADLRVSLPTVSGLPVVISAPSAAGKSTVAAKVVQHNPSACLSTSCTTRQPRAGEKDGRDYFFLSEAEFKKRIDHGAFLEWAIVHTHYYGTPIAAFEEELSKGKDVLLTIDPQGALAVRRLYPHGVFVFIVPPTWDALLERLSNRGTDDESAKQIRVANAKKELGYLSSYDYLVVNDDLDVAVSDVEAIIRAEHRRLSRVNKSDIPILQESRSGV